MKVLLVTLLFFSLVNASLRELLQPAVDQLGPVVESFYQPVSTVPVDGRMGLALDEVYRELFRAAKSEGYRVNRDMPNRSSLQITGSFFFDQHQRTLSVELYLFNGTVQYASTGKIDLTAAAADAVPGFSFIFNGGVEEQQLLYRAYLGDRFKAIFNGNEFPELLLKARSFTVKSDYGELSWKQQIVLDRLQAMLGIHFVQNGEGELKFSRTGSLEVKLNGKTNRINSLFPAQKENGRNVRPSYFSSGGGSFERVVPSLPIEMTILSQITSFFNSEYPSLFSDFDPKSLRLLFPNLRDTTVMKGSVFYRGAGEPDVSYSWVTPQRWISGLEQMANNGREFLVSCDVAEIIQDPHAEFRFWVVVHQRWKTLDEAGNIRYEDSGILLINTDFTPQGEMLSVQIHYRLWFYDYGGIGDNHYGFSSLNRLKSDVDQGVARIKGVDSSLKAVVKEAIFQSVSSM